MMKTFMKKILLLLGSAAVFCAGMPFQVLAAEAGSEAAGAVPLALCIPFVGLLLCIAVLPLVKAEWWEKHQIHAVVLWSLLFIVPFAVRYGSGTALETVLECLVGD